MSFFQKEITLKPYSRGFHLITDEVLKNIPEITSLHVGMCNIFIKHTSASLTINENVDPSVRSDMENFYTDIADDKNYYKHTYEGRSDMPAHIKNSLIGSSLSIPITKGEFNLGIWQGIYLCEHKDYADSRTIVVTIMGS